MSKEVIAVDIDEVLFPFAAPFTAYHNELHGTDLTEEDILTYVYPKDLELPVEVVVERIYSFHQEDDSHIQPIEGSQTALDQLRKDFTFAALTGRHPQFESSTQAQLGTHFPGVFSELYLVGYHEVVENPVTKVEICQKIGATALIDDLLFHLAPLAETNIEGVLFGQYPWNKDLKLPSGVTRCKDWPAVLEYFDGRS